MERQTLYFRKSKAEYKKQFLGYESLDAAINDKSTILAPEVFRADMESLGQITQVMVPTRTLIKKGENEKSCDASYDEEDEG